mgnify:CR=1 FL=1
MGLSMPGWQAGRRSAAHWVVFALVLVVLVPLTAAGQASRLERLLSLGDLRLQAWAYCDGDKPEMGTLSLTPLTVAEPSLESVLVHSAGDPKSDSLEARGDRKSRSPNPKIVGGSMFASGLFLCSWGITSWQRKEDQCCPPRNTENVLKIIVGLVLVNAGLAYLLGAVE